MADLANCFSIDPLNSESGIVACEPLWGYPHRASIRGQAGPLFIVSPDLVDLSSNGVLNSRKINYSVDFVSLLSCPYGRKVLIGRFYKDPAAFDATVRGLNNPHIFPLIKAHVMPLLVEQIKLCGATVLLDYLSITLKNNAQSCVDVLVAIARDKAVLDLIGVLKNDNEGSLLKYAQYESKNLIHILNEKLQAIFD